jgi:SAM-dependent methyltransferase
MNSRPISGECVPAYHTPITSGTLRFYSQAQVLAGPENPERFGQAVEAFRRAFSERPVARPLTSPGTLVELEQEDTDGTPPWRQTVVSTFEALGYDRGEIRRLLTDYEWKVRQLADRHDRILSVGCNRGDELVFLRARYPDAKITALDYPQPGGMDRIVDRVGCDFIAGEIFDSLAEFRRKGRSFDLIFSNHVIEHLFDPDREIGSMAGLLRQGGEFSAGVPLDAYPHQALLAKKAKRPDLIHALDINWLDPRHPWKTNELDLATTLGNAGLEDVKIYRRLHHTSRPYPISLEGCRRREKKGALFYSLLVAPVVFALKGCFGRNPPRFIARMVFAADRRLWFGRYRLKCDVQPEVFVAASKGQGAEGGWTAIQQPKRHLE